MGGDRIRITIEMSREDLNALKRHLIGFAKGILRVIGGRRNEGDRKKG